MPIAQNAQNYRIIIVREDAGDVDEVVAKIKTMEDIKAVDAYRPVKFFEDNRLLYLELDDLKTIDERLIGQLLKGDSDLLSNITHQVLATEIGTAREVVSRKLRRFESDGLIRSSRGRIEILDREKLGSLLGSPNT